MHKILFLLPDLNYRGASQQVRLLATGLAGQSYHVQVCALHTPGPVGDQLGTTGIRVACLGWRRWLDAAAFLRLRRLLREFRPDTLHTWGMAALRLAALALPARRHLPPRFLASAALPPRRAGFMRTRMDGWALAQASHVVARSSAEADRYQRLGVLPGKIHLAVPGVELGPTPQVRPAALPPDARVILCVGPVEPHKGFRTAIWALDILRYLYRDLHLVILGRGSHSAALRQFARSIAVDPFVHFPGEQEDLSGWLHAAEVVWTPSHASGGVQVALEAMAAGRPVVAAAASDLAELVADGVTGFLTPPADPVALARQTRLLLDDESLRRQQGAAGRERVWQSFTAEHLVRRFARLYNAPAV